MECRLCYSNIMWKLETTQIDKVDAGWQIHKYQVSQALSSLQDNLEDLNFFIALVSLPFVIDYSSIAPIFCLLLLRNYWG